MAARPISAGFLSILAFHASAGQDWTQQSPAPTDVHLYGADFMSADTGFIAGEFAGDGGVWRTTDGGDTWTTLFQDSFVELADLDMLTETTGWAVGDRLYKTTSAWFSRTSTPLPAAPAGENPAVTATRIEFIDTNTPFLSTRPSAARTYLYRSDNGGATWTPLGVFALDSWRFTDAQTGWAARLNGEIVRTTDGGQTWTPVGQPPVQSAFVTVAAVFDTDHAIITTFINSSVGFITQRTTDGGMTWSQSPPGAPRFPVFKDPMNGYGHVQFGPLARTTDGGMTWTQTADTRDVHEAIREVVLAGPDTVYAVGDFGYVLKSSDAGQSWTPTSNGSGQVLRRIGFADRFNGWATGEGNTILHTTDGGLTWTHQRWPEDPAADFGTVQDIWAWSPTFAYIMFSDSDIITTTDAGETWHHADPGREWPEQGVSYFADPNRGWMVHYNGGELRTTTDGGATWTINSTGVGPFPFGDTVQDVFFLDDLHGWFVGGVNRAYKTTDGGQTWTRTLSVLRSPAIIYRRVRFADPDHGWIVGNDGIIFYTDDGGDTWDEQTLPGSLGDHIQDLVVTSPTEAYLCSSDGPSGAVLRHTTDAGDTWFNEYLGPGVNDPRSGVTNGIAVVGDAVWTAGTGGDIRHLPPSCRGDLSGDGVLDLADLAAFVNAFLTQQPPADFDANGVWDLADLALFVQAFQAGCP